MKNMKNPKIQHYKNSKNYQESICATFLKTEKPISEIVQEYEEEKKRLLRFSKNLLFVCFCMFLYVFICLRIVKEVYRPLENVKHLRKFWIYFLMSFDVC